MAENLDLWRKAGKVGARSLMHGASLIRPGASLLDVAEEIEGMIRKGGCQPAFPANVSRNEEAAHYTPSPGCDLRFREGDVVKLDVGAHVEGYISDNALTIEVGTNKRKGLVAASKEALTAASSELHGGMDTTAVSKAIEGAIFRRGFKPVSNLMGHNVERYLLHAGKSVPNVSANPSSHLSVGDVVAVEPFATNGVGRISNGPFGNIMRFRARPDPDREPELMPLFSQFSTLPFCLRWIGDDDLKKLPLRKSRLVQSYPVFVEEGNGLVSQAEKTFLITQEGVEVLTPAP